MPIPFTCPHCGAQSTVDDEFLGQTGACATCGQTITVPAPSGQVDFGGANRSARDAWPWWGVSIAIVGSLIVALGIGGIFAYLRDDSQKAARISQCGNNLKQIAVAMQNYRDVWGSFPPAYIADASGRPMHSWRVLILPYMSDGQYVYERYDFSEPWDGPNNSGLADGMPYDYRCPGAGDGPQNTTHYMVVVGRETAFRGSLLDPAFRDGPHLTIMVVESVTAIDWMAPIDLEFDQMNYAINDPRGDCIGSSHAGGANVAFFDGSVRFLRDDLDKRSVKGLLTSSGGESVDLQQR